MSLHGNKPLQVFEPVLHDDDVLRRGFSHRRCYRRLPRGHETRTTSVRGESRCRSDRSSKGFTVWRKKSPPSRACPPRSTRWSCKSCNFGKRSAPNFLPPAAKCGGQKKACAVKCGRWG